MSKPCLTLLMFFLSCSCSVLAASSESSAREEIILFSAAGFTNRSGSNSEQNDRAVEAARYLVERKIEQLFSGLGRHPNSLPAGWSEGISIIDTIPFETVETNNLYGVRLLGRVNLTLSESTSAPGRDDDQGLLETRFTSPKNIFFTGENISFNLSGSRDFYACILDVNEKQETIQLLPNMLRRNNNFTGGREYIFPDAASGDNFRLEVSPPYGREAIRLIASSYPIPPILPINGQDVFAVSSRTFEELMLLVLEGITDNLIGTGSSRHYQFVQITINTLSLKTEER